MRRLLLSFALAACVVAAGPAYAQQGAGSMAMPSCASGDPVVWVNTSSKKYHMQGDSYYGKTKHGKYLCKSAADSAGDRLAKSSSMKSYGAAAGAGMGSAAEPSPMASGMMGSRKHHHRHHGMGMASPMPSMAPSPGN